MGRGKKKKKVEGEKDEREREGENVSSRGLESVVGSGFRSAAFTSPIASIISETLSGTRVPPHRFRVYRCTLYREMVFTRSFE